MDKILEILKASVKIKIAVKPILNRVIDEVLEPALQKIVDDSSNPFDNILKASIYPALSKEIKDRAGAEIDKLKDLLPESVKPFIELE